MKKFLEVTIIICIIGVILYYINNKFYYITPEPKSLNLTDSIPSAKFDTIPDIIETPVKLPFNVIENVMIVKGNIGGCDLDFILDTGCSDVQIGIVEYEFFKRRGIIEGPIDSITTVLADGSEVPSITVKLKNFTVAEQNIGPTKCIVSSNPDAPLLMGYNVLKNLGNIQIDHKNNIITLIK